MSYQIVTVYAGQRIAEESRVPFLREARELAEDLWRDAPLQIVSERTGVLEATFDGARWRYGDGQIVGVAE